MLLGYERTEDDEPDLLSTDSFDQQSKHIRSWLDNVAEFYKTHIGKGQHQQQLKFVEEEELRIVKQQPDILQGLVFCVARGYRNR
jgi:hypothetical protein